MNNGKAGLSLLKVVKRRLDSTLSIPPEGDVSLGAAWALLQDHCKASPTELASRLAQLARCETAGDLTPTQELLDALPQQQALELNVLPLRREEQAVVVATANPFDLRLESQLGFVFGCGVVLEVAPAAALREAIAKAYGVTIEDPAEGSLELSAGGEGSEVDSSNSAVAQTILGRAIDARASDLHVQPFLGGAVVRFRVDGIARRDCHISAARGAAVIRYFKARAGMDPTNPTIPQDGRIRLSRGEQQEFDLRVSTLPTSGGREKLVIRILSSQREFRLGESGLSLDEMRRIRRLGAQPSGVLLFCGPTGSGKTTTLYSILNELNSEEVVIATVENPVEYQIPGLAQTEVNDKAGMTFAAALRSVLRQDPDIILVGEIRDEETAQIAMQAALTGHLVLSTLHTRSSLAAIPRIVDLGVEPTVLSEALIGVVSQRLLRRLCQRCAAKTSEPLTPEESAFAALSGAAPPLRVGGCEACRSSGYAGRFAATEILEITPDLATTISEGRVGQRDLQDVLPESFRSLASVVASQVSSGTTTAREATRVLGRGFWTETAKVLNRPLPDLGSVLAEGRSSGAKAAVLVTGCVDDWDEAAKQAFSDAWLTPLFADTPEAAGALLKEHEEVEVILLGLKPGLSDEEQLAFADAYRATCAWARLPAIVWYPADQPTLPDVFRQAGLLTRFIPSNQDAQRVVTVVSEGIRSGDTLWGRDAAD